MLLVRKYDLDENKKIITNYIDQCEGDDWMLVEQRMFMLFGFGI